MRHQAASLYPSAITKNKKQTKIHSDMSSGGQIQPNNKQKNEVYLDAQRSSGWSITINDLSFSINQKLCKVPLDAVTKKPTLLQKNVKKSGRKPSRVTNSNQTQNRSVNTQEPILETFFQIKMSFSRPATSLKQKVTTSPPSIVSPKNRNIQ